MFLLDFLLDNTVVVKGERISLKRYDTIKRVAIEYIRAVIKGETYDLRFALSEKDLYLLGQLFYEHFFIEDLEKTTGMPARDIINVLQAK
jgi:hypothetical protein